MYSCYALAFVGLRLDAVAITDNGAVGTISLPASPITLSGTLIELGDTDADDRPEFRFQNL